MKPQRNNTFDTNIYLYMQNIINRDFLQVILVEEGYTLPVKIIIFTCTRSAFYFKLDEWSMSCKTVQFAYFSTNQTIHIPLTHISILVGYVCWTFEICMCQNICINKSLLSKHCLTKKKTKHNWFKNIL